MYKKILNIFLIVLVFIYIIFEELVWEKLAKPILSFITNLSLFKEKSKQLKLLTLLIKIINWGKRT